MDVPAAEDFSCPGKHLAENRQCILIETLPGKRMRMLVQAEDCCLVRRPAQTLRRDGGGFPALACQSMSSHSRVGAPQGLASMLDGEMRTAMNCDGLAQGRFQKRNCLLIAADLDKGFADIIDAENSGRMIRTEKVRAAVGGAAPLIEGSGKLLRRVLLGGVNHHLQMGAGAID
jgi:hypothetical protein